MAYSRAKKNRRMAICCRPVSLRPFNEALRIALRQRPTVCAQIADRLIDKAEEGDLSSIRELVDRLDGRPVQMIDRHDVVITELTDAELYLIASGGRAEGELQMNVMSPKD
jgi:hypothetical protein